MASELPTVDFMKKKFPNYPCGICNGCRYKGNTARADECARASCCYFKKWFKSEWQEVRSKFGKPEE